MEYSQKNVESDVEKGDNYTEEGEEAVSAGEGTSLGGVRAMDESSPEVRGLTKS